MDPQAGYRGKRPFRAEARSKVITIAIASNGLVKAEGDLVPGQKIIITMPSGVCHCIVRVGNSLQTSCTENK